MPTLPFDPKNGQRMQDSALDDIRAAVAEAEKKGAFPNNSSPFARDEKTVV